MTQSPSRSAFRTRAARLFALLVLLIPVAFLASCRDERGEAALTAAVTPEDATDEKAAPTAAVTPEDAKDEKAAPTAAVTPEDATDEKTAPTAAVTPEDATDEKTAPTALVTPEEAKDESKKGKHKANRLIREKSPYLRQHAYNPVDWYPWGKEAFQKARAEGKVIFLSIGYSTCHWCHVMERESFEDEKIAAYLNKNFVCIKVDREERPDVDGVYMDFVQALTGRGGWPLSAFLTPEGKPFFGGTYFPPQNFETLLGRVLKVWAEQRAVLVKQADDIASRLQAKVGRFQREQKDDKLAATVTDAGYSYLEEAHDEIHGGFSGPPRYAPKFPRTSNLDFLLRYGRRTGKRAAEKLVYTTLDNMIAGGIYDHLGGGFHRYSTDRVWLLPHFEKMLYDNALITRTLIDAYRVSGNERYLGVVRESLEYVLRRLRDPKGGFRCAEDADTDGVEGLTYVWGRKEITDLLGEQDGALFCERYGVEAAGNFHEERSDPNAPKHQNVLHVKPKEDLASLAKKHGVGVEELERRLADARAKLLVVRDRKPQPFLDDKVLVEWNGLMISALSHGFQVTGEKRYLDAARDAAGFISSTMIVDGKLMRRYKDDEVKIRGFLEDYAFLIDGLIDLYESDFDPRWLELATKLAKEMVTHFWDEKEGAFFSSSKHHEQLILRRKEFYDGAVPSGNSVAFLDLLRLKEFTQDRFFDAPIARFTKIAGGLLAQNPHMHPQLACAAEFLLAAPLEIVIVGPSSDPGTQAMVSEVRRRFLPGKVVLHAESAKAADRMKSLVPLMESKLAIQGKATAFVCRQQVCQLPARSLEDLRTQLDQMSRPLQKPKPAEKSKPPAKEPGE